MAIPETDTIRHDFSDGSRIETALPVWSDRLGLTGKCDVVEFLPDGTPYPVEYKHGARKKGMNDDIQFAAQALCLEESIVRSHERARIETSSPHIMLCGPGCIASTHKRYRP